jgi:hypothetical protein
VVGALRSVVEDLRVEDLDSLPVGRIRDDLLEIELVSGWLEAERSRRVAAFAAKRGVEIEGHGSVTAFLKHRCRVTGGRAQRIVAMANRLWDLPFVEKALSVGDISFDQARVFTNLPDHLSGCLARDVVTLVNAVEPLSVADTRRVVEYWRSAVDGPGCDATVSRMVFGPESEPVDIGRAPRVVPPGMRRAAIARDRHCTHPGCDRPARWCDVHHIWHWADGGPTALQNLKLLCRYHHTLEHRRSRSPRAS